MSHTNSTPNYNLPQFITTDKPAWLTDVNNAYTAIDTAVHNAQTKADTAFTDAGNAQTDATTAINNAAAADAKGSGALASIANAFDTTSIYAVNDLVIYNGLLYICSIAVTTPGQWTGSNNWSRITVEDLIPTSAGDLPLGSNTPAGSTAAAIANVATPELLSISGTGEGVSNNSRAYKISNKLLLVIFDFSLATGVYDGWKVLFDIPYSTPFSNTPFGTAITEDGSEGCYLQAFYNTNKITVRANKPTGGKLIRGQMLIPIQ